MKYKISGYKAGKGRFYHVYDEKHQFKRNINVQDEKTLAGDDWLNGVSCFVINEKGEVLIEQRVKKGLTPGKLDLCSGHIDNGETATIAMIRELREELGISFEEAINVRKLSIEALPLKFSSSNKIKNFFITFYCLKRSTSDVKPQEEEIDEILWLPLDEAFELIRSGKTKFPPNDNYELIFQKVRDICNPNKIKEEFGRD